MNNQERKIHYYLLGTQGTYYFFLGITAFSFQLVTDLYLIDKAPRAIYLTSLATAFLLGIGITLFLAKKYYKQSLYGGVLGIITAVAFFIHHSIFLYEFDSSPYLWVDWIFQLSFLLAWIWLFYWKWIEDKFANL